MRKKNKPESFAFRPSREQERKSERQIEARLNRKHGMDIPQYGFIKEKLKARQTLLYTDTEHRIYSPLHPDDFPGIFHTLGPELNEQPWVVFIPKHFHTHGGLLSFPLSQGPDVPWVRVTHEKTGATFDLYCTRHDFRAGRNVGLAYVCSARLVT